MLCFFAFTSLTTVDLLMMERKMVLREVRGEWRQAPPGAGRCRSVLAQAQEPWDEQPGAA